MYMYWYNKPNSLYALKKCVSKKTHVSALDRSRKFSVPSDFSQVGNRLRSELSDVHHKNVAQRNRVNERVQQIKKTKKPKPFCLL